MDNTNIALVERHIQIWNETDLSRRNEVIADTYADDIEMVDSHFIATGAAEINDFIDGLHAKSPGSRFTHSRKIEAHHNVARLFWQFGSRSGPGEVSGMDFLVIENGKVKKLYVFVDEKG